MVLQHTCYGLCQSFAGRLGSVTMLLCHRAPWCWHSSQGLLPACHVAGRHTKLRERNTLSRGKSFVLPTGGRVLKADPARHCDAKDPDCCKAFPGCSHFSFLACPTPGPCRHRARVPSMQGLHAHTQSQLPRAPQLSNARSFRRAAVRAARKSAKLVNGRQHLQVGCHQADLLHPAQQPVSCAAVAMCRSGMHRHCLHISTAWNN